MRSVAKSILSRINRLSESLGLNCRAILVGSAARGTWLAGDHDLDIFIAVSEETDLTRALELARIVAPEHEEKYAEHPYVHAFIEGFDVDLVPCYLLESAACIKSAVDRTPFHTQYISAHIESLEDEVLLLKQFMKGIGVYGSELKVGGFSGYLAELLILRYGSFIDALKAASSWRPGEIIDLEKHSIMQHNEPLIVVDPVDPARNVAAALTLDKMLQFESASRCFLKAPDIRFFFPERQKPLSDERLMDAIQKRKSCFILIEFDAPNVVEDILFPQLRKAEDSVRALLKRNEFSVLRSDVCSYSDKASMLLELDIWKLPDVVRRIGPPVWDEQNLARFLEAHPNILSGPYIENGRAVVEVTRKYMLAIDLLEKEISSISLGKHLSAEIKKGYKIYVNQELSQIKDEAFRIFLADYLEKRTKIC
ncbi:MAG: CCA tRNA nucleotidyltransferase [Methanotrichaceae archaeon]